MALEVMILKVHEAARLLGVTPRTLRFYEEKGLIHPGKLLENNYRSYSEHDLIRLRWIISLRELGISLSSIHEALASINEPETFIRKVESSRAQLYEQWITASKALQSLDVTISEWRRSRFPDLVQIEYAAEEMKRNRLVRASWSDQWDYNGLALQHGFDTPLVSLGGLLSEEQYNDALINTVEWLDPGMGELGLELAPGSGNLSALLVRAGAKLTAVEQSAEMLAILRGRLPAVEAKLGNMLALPLAAQSYSFIACTFAMHHLNTDQQLMALEEMDRVLLPGGRLAVTGIMKLHDDEDVLKSAFFKDKISPTTWYPSLASSLINWLEGKGYSTMLASLTPVTALLYASKR